ncbi:MAG: Mov34/MPN/PAD-1 family protein [Nanoarchaeota archaeon]|nr:Mov34/MPN/PAD-1 family protein [Nanoarchaeota archaeon]
MKGLPKKIADYLSTLLPKRQPITDVIIKKEVVREIIDFAKENHPREFVSLLQGKVGRGRLVIDNMIFQKYASNFNSATMTFNLPMLNDVVGSVHSHPGPGNTPSRADLKFFDRKGLVHLIIAYPYRIETMAGYDFEGNRIDFRVE